MIFVDEIFIKFPWFTRRWTIIPQEVLIFSVVLYSGVNCTKVYSIASRVYLPVLYTHNTTEVELQ